MHEGAPVVLWSPEDAISIEDAIDRYSRDHGIDIFEESGVDKGIHTPMVLWCYSNECEHPNCHRCYPIQGCTIHDKCQEPGRFDDDEAAGGGCWCLIRSHKLHEFDAASPRWSSGIRTKVATWT
jgi:hypothetical protein